VDHGTGGLRRDAEALDVDAVFRHTGGQQRGLGLVVHLVRAADVDVVDAAGRHHTAQEVCDLVAVHQTHVERRVGGLVAEHVVQRQPREVLVLQVLELFLEHRGLEHAVAVDQRRGGQGLARQHRLQDRQDGRDAAATRDAHMVAARGRVQRHEEAALRRHHGDAVARLQTFVDPVGEHAPLDLAHAHAQFAVVDAGTDAVAASQVLAADGLAQRQVLALREGVGGAQRIGHVEADDHRLGGVGVDAAHRQVVEKRRAHDGQIGLKCSNGSRQATQRYSALQAVAPKADRRSVRSLPQRGQATAAVRRMKRMGWPALASTGPGGAMPYSRSLRLPSSLIQSVVQAGARCMVTVTGPMPASVSASTTLCSMTSVAGQPL
jgi:hypothetical protein